MNQALLNAARGSGNLPPAPDRQPQVVERDKPKPTPKVKPKKAKEPFVFVAPDGTEYPWTQSTPPTDADVQAIVRYHETEGKYHSAVQSTLAAVPKFDMSGKRSVFSSLPPFSAGASGKLNPYLMEDGSVGARAQVKPPVVGAGGKVAGTSMGGYAPPQIETNAVNNLVNIGSADPSRMVKGYSGLLGDWARGVAAEVNAAANPVALVLHRQLPNGLLKPELEKAMRESGTDGKIWAETIKNLDPTQVPAFVAQVTEKADSEGNTGLANMGKGMLDVFQRISEGDEDAAAQLMGMWNAFAFSTAAGMTAKGAMVRTPNLPDVQGRMNVNALAGQPPTKINPKIERVRALQAARAQETSIHGGPRETVKAGASSFKEPWKAPLSEREFNDAVNARSSTDVLGHGKFIPAEKQRGTAVASRLPNGKIQLNPKFFEMDAEGRANILRHESLHGIEDQYVNDAEWGAIFTREGKDIWSTPDEALLTAVENYHRHFDDFSARFPDTARFIKDRVLRENPEVGQLYGKPQQKTVQAPNKATKPKPSPEDTPLRKALLAMDPDDLRLDPFSETFDPKLHESVLREFGEGEFVNASHALENARSKVTDFYEGMRTKGEFKESLLQDSRRPGVEVMRRWHKGRNGGWYPDHRGVTHFASLDGYDNWLREDIVSYIEANSKGEFVYANLEASKRWGTGASKPPPGALRMEEFVRNAGEAVGGDSVYAKQRVPRHMLGKYARELMSDKDIAKAIKKELNLDAEEVEAALRYHLRDAEEATGRGADATVKEADGSIGQGQAGQAKEALSTAPRPSKPLVDMTEAEFDDFREQVRAWEKGPGSEKAILGGKYDEFKRLDRAGDDLGIKKLLTDEEWDAVYGRQPGQMFLDEVDDFTRETNAVRTSKTPKELGFWLRHKLANPEKNAQAIIIADRLIKEKGWNPDEVMDTAMVAHALSVGDLSDTAFMYSKSLQDVIDAAERFTSGKPSKPKAPDAPRLEQKNMNPPDKGRMFDVEPELKLEAEATPESKAKAPATTKKPPETIEDLFKDDSAANTVKGQASIFTDPDGVIRLNSNIDIPGLLKRLNDPSYRVVSTDGGGPGSFTVERADPKSGLGYFERFRSPLSVVDWDGTTIQRGGYERLAGQLGKDASETIRNAQIEIDRLTTAWEHALDRIGELYKGALDELAKAGGVKHKFPANRRKAVLPKLIEVIESEFDSPLRKNLTGDLKQLVEAHDELTGWLREYIIAARRELGYETPDNWGITDRGYFRHLFLGDIRLFVDGKFKTTARTYAEAQKLAIEISLQEPSAEILAKPRVSPMYADVLRVTTKRYMRVARNVADTAGITMKEMMEDLQGEVGMKSRRLKFFGALKQRTGAQGYSLDYMKVMRMHVAQVARTQELSKLNRALVPIIEDLKGKGYRGVAEAMEDHLDAIWGTPTKTERAFGDTIRNTPILRNHVANPDFALRGLAMRLTRLQTFLKLSWSVRSSAVNMLQPYSTLGPYITTKDFARLHAEMLKPDTWRMLKEKGIVTGDVKLEETMTGKKPGKTLFRMASGWNRGMGYMYGYKTALSKGATEAAAHKSGLTWAELVEFDNSVWNGAPVFRSPQAKVLGQFKGFLFKNLEHWQNALRKHEGDVKGARALRIAQLTGAQLTLGGLKGFGVLATAAGGYKLVEFLSNQLQQLGADEERAKAIAEAVYYGAPSLLGTDLSASVSILEAPYGNTLEERILGGIIGPTGGMAVDLAKEGYNAATAEDKTDNGGTTAEDKRAKAAERAAKAVTPYYKNTKAAIRLYQSKDGKTYLQAGSEEIELTPFEAVMLSLGFNPLKQSRHYDMKDAKVKEEPEVKSLWPR